MEKEDPIITRFRNYLRINTMQPDVDYKVAVKFLEDIGKELSLECTKLEPYPQKDILILTWKGTDPSLPSLLLNSHMDVVPVFQEHWTYPPFEAVKDSSGKIFARGAQDMKCVGMQYLEAIRKFKSAGVSFPRTIHVSFVPDEEIGSHLGMRAFVQTEEFQKLNVGFGLDEGIASPTDAFKVFYGERNSWWIKVSCTGNPGHGSQFIANTSGEKLHKMINFFMEFRNEQKKKLENDPSLTLGDVTSVNFTMVEGGAQPNVVPSELSATFDCRISPWLSTNGWLEILDKWRTEAGDGINYTFLQADKISVTTPIDDSNLWWKAFSSACQEMKMSIITEVFPAGTDARFLREAGIPALGFSPMNNTPILLHDHNEYLEESVYLRGIDIYEKIISNLAAKF